MDFLAKKDLIDFNYYNNWEKLFSLKYIKHTYYNLIN